jgi:hypothetical protein
MARFIGLLFVVAVGLSWAAMAVNIVQSSDKKIFSAIDCMGRMRYEDASLTPEQAFEACQKGNR